MPDSQLIERARKLGPLLHEHANEAEANRRLARPIVDALRHAGFLRLTLPRALGGLETDPITLARVVEELARFDASAAWLLMVANSMAWWAARLPGEGVDEIWGADPNAIVASAFNPPVQATRVDGGVRITGRRAFASHISEASWVMLVGLIDGTEAIGALFRRDECLVIDTWHVLGMRGTDSNDVAVDDVFVPATRTFAMQPTFEPSPHFGSALYRVPAYTLCDAIVPPIALSIARCAIDELCTIASAKTPFASATTLRDRASAQAAVGRADALVRGARALLYEALAESWERTLAGTESTLQQKTDLLMAGTHAVQCSAEAVDLVFTAAGCSAIYNTSRLERCFRDANVLRQHGFANASRYETVGQVRFGLSPDLSFVVL